MCWVIKLQRQEQSVHSIVITCSKTEEREYEAAKNSAAGSLSLRPHSRKELEIKLEDKGYSVDAISRALDRLAELVPLTPFAIMPAAQHMLSPLYAMFVDGHTHIWHSSSIVCMR